MSNGAPKKAACKIACLVGLVGVLLFSHTAPAVASQPASQGVLHIKSHYSVERTVERAKRILEHNGLRVFGVIDYQDDAKRFELSLPPTQLLVFGQAQNSTKLMHQNRLIGIDLPMKLLVWQDDQHIVWISYTDPKFLKGRHRLKAPYKEFEEMRQILQDISQAAAR